MGVHGGCVCGHVFHAALSFQWVVGPDFWPARTVFKKVRLLYGLPLFCCGPCPTLDTTPALRRSRNSIRLGGGGGGGHRAALLCRAQVPHPHKGKIKKGGSVRVLPLGSTLTRCPACWTRRRRSKIEEDEKEEEEDDD